MRNKTFESLTSCGLLSVEARSWQRRRVKSDGTADSERFVWTLQMGSDRTDWHWWLTDVHLNLIFDISFSSMTLLSSRYTHTRTSVTDRLRAKYCDQCVCLSVCVLAYLNKHIQTLRNFLQCSDANVTYFRFVDDVIFAHNGSQWVNIKDNVIFRPSSPDGGTGNDVAIYDCRLVRC